MTNAELEALRTHSHNRFDNRLLSMTPWPEPQEPQQSYHPSKVLRLRKNRPRLTTVRHTSTSERSEL